MGQTNYKLTEEEKKELLKVSDVLIDLIQEKCEQVDVLDIYKKDGTFDNNKFTAMVWFLGDELSSY